MQKVVTSFNLNLLLKLFFYSLILTNNNLLLKIYCENIVVTFLNQNFLFFILFLISFISFRPYVFFFLLVFLLHTRCPISIPPFFLFSFSPSFKNVPALYQQLSFSLFFSPTLTLCFFFFLFDSRTFVPNAIQIGHLRPKAIGLAQSRRSSSSPTQSRWVRWLLSSVFFFFFFFLL